VGKYPDAYHWVIKKQPAERATLSAGRVMPEYHSKPFAQEILRQRMWGSPYLAILSIVSLAVLPVLLTSPLAPSLISYTVENPGGNDTNEESLRYIEAFPITPD
jgi:hypothetical protein